MNLRQVEQWFIDRGFNLDGRFIWDTYRQLIAMKQGEFVRRKYDRHVSDPTVPGGLRRLPPLANEDVKPFDWDYELERIAKDLKGRK